MAIYHFNASFVSRSSGRSAVQSAAYITGTKLKETRRDITADYRNRASSVLFYETFAPNHAPDEMRRLTIWDATETYEDHYAIQRYRKEEAQEKYKSSAQVAQTIVVALPKELAPEVWQELVTDFVKERFVSRGLVVTVAIHKDEGNPHAHFQISRRRVTEQGEWSLTKDREIVNKSELIESRWLWAEKTNFYLSREGFEVRIDHRSYADMGLPFEPTKHESWYAQQLEKIELKSRIVEENREIKDRNKEYSGLHPEAILKELTSKQATFSSLDLSRLIQKRLGNDPILASYVYEASLSQAAIVGTSLDGQTRYTSREYIQLEVQALSLTQTLMNGKTSLVIQESATENLLKNPYHYLNQEQQQAVKTLSGDQQLSVLVGRAGTGKTTTLKPVVELHLQAGYQVLGLSLSAAAAENLALETDCNAETVAFYLDKWDRLEQATQELWSPHSSSEQRQIEKKIQYLEPYALTDRDLVIIDEAGMIGTAQWASLLRYVEKAKTKLMIVGDDHQFKAIEAGDFFRKLQEEALSQNKLSTLKKVVRQKEDWMKVASEDLAELRTYQALSTYEKQGCLKKLETADLSSIAQAYVEKRSASDESGLLLASTRAQCQALNTEVRKLLKEQRTLSTVDSHINGRSFSVGDEIVFLKNDRDKTITCLDSQTEQVKAFFVKNGTKAKILSIQETSEIDPNSGELRKTGYQLRVEINTNTLAQFNSRDYPDLDHSYALTLHKSQGQTTDWSMIYASQNIDAYALYVALTRHRKEVSLFYDAQTFASFKDLQKSLSRLSKKDLAIDYSIQSEHQGVWENVQEYLLLGQDLMALVREKNWSNYNSLKKERDALGQTILSDWKDHVSYAKQAGLTQESLEIACGLKMRPLSLVEQQAYQTIQEYAQKAMEARLLWREISASHPGKNCCGHSRYSEFTDLRQARNNLAKEIIGNQPLYKEFIHQLGRDLGIGWKALTDQANQKIFAPKPFYKSSFKEQPEFYPETFVNNDFQKSNSTKTFFRETFIKVDSQQVKRELNERIESLSSQLLGEPNHRTGREWRYGKKGSISICIIGAKQGLYSDFERGSYGGGLKLIQDSLNLDYKEAYKWALDWLGLSNQKEAAYIKPAMKQKEAGQPILQDKAWVPIFPVPSQMDNNPQFKKCLSYQLEKNHRQETGRYAYRDAEGNLLGYTIRLENKEGKVVLPLTYCQSPDGKYRLWRWQGFGSDRPLYGLEKLKDHPDKPVLIVEGEKTANSAQRLFPDYVVLTWLGGTGSVNQTDWSPLKDKPVVIWPDNDTAGLNAANKIAACLAKINPEKETEAAIVKLPANTPEKWDLADALPQEWTSHTLREMLNSAKNPQKAILSSSIQETLTKHGLEKPAHLSDKDFENYIQESFKKMSLWHKISGGSSLIENNQKLMEKAVITQAIQYKTKQEYCFLATPAEALIRSEGIALVTAGLMQKDANNQYSKKLLQQAANIYDEQLKNQSQNLFKEYKKLHPEISSRQLEILVDHSLQCWNMVSRNLTEDAQKAVLNLAKKFETLLKNQELSQLVHDYMKKSVNEANKENEKAVIQILERHYIEKNINKNSENTVKFSELSMESQYSSQVNKISPDRQKYAISLNPTSKNQKDLER